MDVTTGSPNVVVAVVDTGYRPHADLAGRVLPGYDFISDPFIANDGDGRDARHRARFGKVTQADLSNPSLQGQSCTVEDSSWHGTGVTGIIAANSNNGQWIAGIDWAAKILPVRVLGKCGGNDSDIIDGIAWAAGLAVPGAPANPYPAQVINLSLGGAGECEAGYHAVFSAALAHGVTRAIIVAAGNDGIDVSNSAPANCGETIAVAATGKGGLLADYSNFGPGIGLSAPGGTGPDLNANGILVLWNDGTTTSQRTVVATLAGQQQRRRWFPALPRCPRAHQSDRRPTARAADFDFDTVPDGSDCDTSRCGAGIVNAHAAVVAAQGGAPAPNYQGLWWNAPANSESGWGINFAHQGDTIFASWFTYDVNGRGWWLVMTAQKTGNVYAGTLYQTHGPPFNAVPFAPSTVTNSAVGTGTLAFADANNGTFTYTVNGTTQTKTITRQVFGAQPTCVWGALSNLALATNYQDLWWNAPAGSESGWGVNFSHQGSTIFLTWFTYDISGSPMWLVATLAQTTNPALFTGTLIRTSGPRFDAFDPSKVVNEIVGSATLTFADGNNATFYTVRSPPCRGFLQIKTITREIFAAAARVQ